MEKKDNYIYHSVEVAGNIKYLAAVIALSFFVVMIRLVYLQVVKNSYYLNMSKQNYIRLIGLLPVRGNIISSNGIICASNKPTFSIYISKNKRIDGKIIHKLSVVLNLPEYYIKNKLSFVGYFQSVILKPDATREDVFRVLSDPQLSKFIDIEVSPKRFYPDDAKIFANVVGYVSEASKRDLQNHPNYKVGESVGRIGVEKKYNDVLRGRWGYKEIEVTANGSIVKTLSETPPKKGADLKLSLNIKLQSYLYNILNSGQYRGSIVVMRPNGHILAMANTGSFNPNYFVEGLSLKKWKKLRKKHLINMFDLSTQGAYPPGSLIKPFIALSALKDGVITPRTVLMCPQSIKIGKNVYRDWKAGGFGKISLKRAIESSSDVFFYQLGMKLGINKMDFYLAQFGFGRSPKLFSYCTKGNLPSRAWKYKKYHQDWYVGDTITTAIGQGFFLVSPLQVAEAFSIIANNGVGYVPVLLKDKKSPIRYVFRSKYYKDIKKYLWLVVNGKYGTARVAKIDGMNICGKTGTSQVVTSKVYKSVKKKLKEHKISIKKAQKYFPHAWFASFAPLNHPKVVVVVFLEHGEHSSKAAKIAKYIYLELKLLSLV